MWAGERKRHEPNRISLAVGFKDPAPSRAAGGLYRYEVEIGFPPKKAAPAFELEPQIKREAVAYVTRSRSIRLLDREGRSVMVRDEAGRPSQVDLDLLDSETALGRLEDPSRYPELDLLRRTLLQWRFYHGLRTDAASAMRRPCPAVATPALASDGADLAAVFATLAHIRQDVADLDAAVEQAFPGARLEIPPPKRFASFGMSYPEFPGRIFEAQELSDGTLHFLALAGALLAYRLPPFIALNEPESSLHPDLISPLSKLIVQAATRSQIWLVTHSDRLAQAIIAQGVGKVRMVAKQKGATHIEGLKAWGEFEDEDE